jgi:DNA-binding NarL/FixJ family response regulator
MRQRVTRTEGPSVFLLVQNTLVRDGLRRLLAKRAYPVVGEASRRDSSSEVLLQIPWEALIIDSFNMGLFSGNGAHPNHANLPTMQATALNLDSGMEGIVDALNSNPSNSYLLTLSKIVNTLRTSYKDENIKRRGDSDRPLFWVLRRSLETRHDPTLAKTVKKDETSWNKPAHS